MQCRSQKTVSQINMDDVLVFLAQYNIDTMNGVRWTLAGTKQLTGEKIEMIRSIQTSHKGILKTAENGHPLQTNLVLASLDADVRIMFSLQVAELLMRQFHAIARSRLQKCLISCSKCFAQLSPARTVQISSSGITNQRTLHFDYRGIRKLRHFHIWNNKRGRGTPGMDTRNT